MIFPRVHSAYFQVGLVFAWSSAFLGAILASNTGSIVRVILWRFIGVSLLFSPFLWKRLRRGVTWRWCALHGTLGAVGMFLCIGLGIEAINLGLPAGTASLIAALQPLATAVFAGLLLRETVVRGQWIGLVIGLVGVLVSVGGLSGGAQLLGSLACFGSVTAMVAATLIAKAHWDGSDFGAAVAFQTLVTAALCVPLAVCNGVFLPQISLQFLDAVLWAVVFSTLGSYGFYYICLIRIGTVRTNSLIYLTPPVTLLWAWVMFGQSISLRAVAGFLLCMIGVYLSTGERTREASPTTERA